MMNQVFRTGLVVLTLSTSSLFAFSQQTTQAKQADVPHGWHLLDRAKDGYDGISLDEAYQFVKSKNLKSNPVIVAVIDSGGGHTA